MDKTPLNSVGSKSSKRKFVSDSDGVKTIKFCVFLGGRNSNQCGPFKEAMRNVNVMQRLKLNIEVEYVDVNVIAL